MEMHQALADCGASADLGGATAIDAVVADVAEVVAPEVVAVGGGDAHADAETEAINKEIYGANHEPDPKIVPCEVNSCLLF